MGRRKIDIVRIENERHRQVTYTKRKAGLLKKATELAILCDAQVAVIIFSQSQKLSVYSSAPMDMLLNRYKEHNDTPEVREPFRSGAANQAAEHRQALAEHTSHDPCNRCAAAAFEHVLPAHSALRFKASAVFVRTCCRRRELSVLYPARPYRCSGLYRFHCCADRHDG